MIEHYPGFEARIRQALRAIVGEKVERRVLIGLAKDGSGVGGMLHLFVWQEGCTNDFLDFPSRSLCVASLEMNKYKGVSELSRFCYLKIVVSHCYQLRLMHSIAEKSV